MLDEVVAALDRRPEGEPAASEQRLRLIWLVSGVEGERRPIPRDLDDVVAELARLGIEDLSTAAQTIIRISDLELFESKFTTNLPTPWTMSLEGQIATGDRGARRVRIGLSGGPIDGSGPGTEIQTTITTAAGHFVVLGATPIKDMDSVFVLQLADVP